MSENRVHLTKMLGRTDVIALGFGAMVIPLFGEQALFWKEGVTFREFRFRAEKNTSQA